MTNTTTAMFDAHAAEYDALRRRLIPPFDAFYGTAIDALDLATRPLTRVLDLGAGTGMLAARVADAHPEARVTLLDGAAAMLDQARATHGGRFDYVVADLVDPLPAGSWDAVVSALAIHHLTDDGKRACYARAAAAIAPGGVFVNAEQVAGANAELEASYVDWHARSSAALGTSAAEWEGALGRMSHDRRAPVADQLQWLLDAGFSAADVLFKDHGFAVLVALR